MKKIEIGRKPFKVAAGRKPFRVAFWAGLKPFLAGLKPFLLFAIPCLYATTPHTITIDGDLSDWHEDELIYDDSQNDSPWGLQNEVHKLYMTWDGSNLYIGVSGVQKDGNNLVVYIDTSPLSGITDASLLREPGNSASMWWWRRGNKFPQNFRPDFQWHLYEMRLNIQEGHGFFRLNPDNTTLNLNGDVEQKSSGGGTGKSGSAEIKIPWSVLFGASDFPTRQEIRIIAMVTGGMDTKGTSDTSDDQFGSARDAIPDQKSSPPKLWYEPFTIDNWLTIKLLDISNISPIPRKLKATVVDKNSIRLNWQLRDVVEKNLSGFNIYYSTNNTNFQKAQTSITTEYMLTELIPDNTYFFYIRAIYNNVEMGKSETVSIYLNRPSLNHTPVDVFPFPGKKINLKLTFDSGVSRVKLFYRFDGSEYLSVEKYPGSSERAVEFAIPTPQLDTELNYYFIVGQNHYLPPLGPSEVYKTSIKSESKIVISEGTNNFGAGVKLELLEGAIKQPTSVVAKTIDPGVFPLENTSLRPVAVYEFYSTDNKNNKVGVLFEKPVKLTLRYFDEDLESGWDENKLAIYRLVGNQAIRVGGAVDASENTISAMVSYLSKYGIFYETVSYSPSAELKRVVRPIFNPSLNEVVEFVTDAALSYEIFDLNYRKIFASDQKFWNGRDAYGNIVPPGVYIYSLDLGTKKIFGSCVVVR